MAYQIFIDGQEGTTGLKILDRLAARPDLEILKIDEEKRKDPAERQKLINASDITFLCLPDAAAIEAAALATNDHVKIIDASTAHRSRPAGPTASRSFPAGTARRLPPPTGSPIPDAMPPASSRSQPRW